MAPARSDKRSLDARGRSRKRQLLQRGGPVEAAVAQDHSGLDQLLKLLIAQLRKPREGPLQPRLGILEAEEVEGKAAEAEAPVLEDLAAAECRRLLVGRRCAPFRPRPLSYR